jgi:hypothetical protein
MKKTLLPIVHIVLCIVATYVAIYLGAFFVTHSQYFFQTFNILP